jgi:hypothetical protein
MGLSVGAAARCRTAGGIAMKSIYEQRMGLEDAPADDSHTYVSLRCPALRPTSSRKSDRWNDT